MRIDVGTLPHSITETGLNERTFTVNEARSRDDTRSRGYYGHVSDDNYGRGGYGGWGSSRSGGGRERRY